MQPPPSPAEAIQRHRDIYSIDLWGEGYFDIGADGNVIVYPTRNKKDGFIDLHRVARDLSQHGLNLPVLLRFGDILRDRVDTLCNAFKSAIEHYTGAHLDHFQRIVVSPASVTVLQLSAHGAAMVKCNDTGSLEELVPREPEPVAEDGDATKKEDDDA